MCFLNVLNTFMYCYIFKTQQRGVGGRCFCKDFFLNTQYCLNLDDFKITLNSFKIRVISFMEFFWNIFWENALVIYLLTYFDMLAIVFFFYSTPLLA